MLKVAIACRGGYVDDKFACEYLAVATVDRVEVEGELPRREVVDESLVSLPEESTPEAVLAALLEHNVTMFFVGKIDDDSLATLKGHGIEVVRGVSGFAVDVPDRWLRGQVQDSEEIVPVSGCGHNHDHGDDHHHHDEGQKYIQ